VIVFPIISTVFSALCAVVLLRDQVRRPRPDKLVWAIAFTMFALAAGADAAGHTFGWTTELARLYYATGPALVVMFLAIGELYLLFPKNMGRFAPGATLLLTAVWVTTVLSAPIDMTRLEEDGWEAIERGSAMVALTVAINSIGTTIIVGGLAWSIWRFWRSGLHRNRMIGCALIAIGTVSVGAGGTLTRLGHYEYLYIAMSIGAALIFFGVLWTRRPDVATSPNVATLQRGDLPAIVRHNGAAPSPMVAIQETSALGYVGQNLLTLTDDMLDQFCTEWSVARDARPVFDRSEARRAWAFRNQLPDDARAQFDRHSVPARRQIVVLYDEVLTHPDASASGETAGE
jgi:hypothetical protein